MQVMAQPIYNVFISRDGSYGVALSQLCAMVRTATGFAGEADAREWITRDMFLGVDDRPLKVPDPAMPRT